MSFGIVFDSKIFKFKICQFSILKLSKLSKFTKVEIKDVRLPVQLQRAMAKEAEETRNANAKVISSKGEQKASVFFKNAAQTISTWVLKLVPISLKHGKESLELSILLISKIDLLTNSWN